MKLVFVVLCLMVTVSAFGFSQGRVSGSCVACPRDAGCTVAFSDGCNTSTCGAWCADGKWYHSDVCMSTLLYCSQSFEFTPAIEFNPISDKSRATK